MVDNAPRLVIGNDMASFCVDSFDISGAITGVPTAPFVDDEELDMDHPCTAFMLLCGRATVSCVVLAACILIGVSS